MKHILITQRIDKIEKINEERESIDIRLNELIVSLGMIPIQLSSKILVKSSINCFLDSLSPDGIILSGGNDIGQYKERDNLEINILTWSQINKIPVIGICRGLQILNAFCNGSLVKVEGHCKTRHMIYGIKEFNNIEVNSYHNFGVTKETLGENLISLAKSNDGCIEALKHKSNPWMGIMWHPEREECFKRNDLDMINCHLN